MEFSLAFDLDRWLPGLILGGYVIGFVIASRLGARSMEITREKTPCDGPAHIIFGLFWPLVVAFFLVVGICYGVWYVVTPGGTTTKESKS